MRGMEEPGNETSAALLRKLLTAAGGLGALVTALVGQHGREAVQAALESSEQRGPSVTVGRAMCSVPHPARRRELLSLGALRRGALIARPRAAEHGVSFAPGGRELPTP